MVQFSSKNSLVSSGFRKGGPAPARASKYIGAPSLTEKWGELHCNVSSRPRAMM
jgi:hypothetical protein